MNKNECKVWIRQVIVPDLMDNENYLKDLATFLKKINNIERINFLPYHKLGDEKYEKLGINNPYKDKIAMDKDKCEQLYQKFLEIYDKEKA